MHRLGLLTLFSLLATSLAAVIPRPLSPSTLPRPNTKHSTVPFGAVINHCTAPGTIALTFDDGPYIYTAQMLDTLAEHGARATFFLNGVNKGSIDGFPDLVQRSIEEGHQLGSHTSAHSKH